MRRVRPAWRKSWDTTNPILLLRARRLLAGAAWWTLDRLARIDAEFLPDVGELHGIGESAIRHHCS
jgi:hypothetical protein